MPAPDPAAVGLDPAATGSFSSTAAGSSGRRRPPQRPWRRISPPQSADAAAARALWSWRGRRRRWTGSGMATRGSGGTRAGGAQAGLSMNKADLQAQLMLLKSEARSAAAAAAEETKAPGRAAQRRQERRHTLEWCEGLKLNDWEWSNASVRLYVRLL